MKEIYTNSKIPFELVIDDKTIYSSPNFIKDSELIQKRFELNSTKCYIYTYVAFSVSIDLLSFCVKNKLEEIFNNKNNLIYSLLDGNYVEEDTIKKVFNILNEEFTLINIYMESNRSEILSDLKECYLENDVEILSYNRHIIVLGIFEDVIEHVDSIRELVATNSKGKVYISYTNITDYRDTRRLYKDSLYKIELAIKYNLTEYIFDENKLILEGIIDSVDKEMKEKIFDKFDKGLSSLDKEMIKTIDIFFKCGLNLSEAAKELYIHRNTLIYRLDKIQKYTSYDIRDFSSAVLLKNVFFIWKEKKHISY